MKVHIDYFVFYFHSKIGDPNRLYLLFKALETQNHQAETFRWRQLIEDVCVMNKLHAETLFRYPFINSTSTERNQLNVLNMAHVTCIPTIGTYLRSDFNIDNGFLFSLRY